MSDQALETIGRRLREERETMGLGIATASQSLAVDRNTLIAIEAGQPGLDTKVFRRAAQFYGVTMKDLTRDSAYVVKARIGNATGPKADEMASWSRQTLSDLRFIRAEVVARSL